MLGAIIVAILLTVGAYKADADSKTILLVPFGADTYVPITPKNISSAYYRYRDGDVHNEQFQMLLGIIKSAPSGTSFLWYGVRARILLPDGRFVYIDDEGDIEWGPRIKRLNRVQFETVKRILNSLTRSRSAPR